MQMREFERSWAVVDTPAGPYHMTSATVTVLVVSTILFLAGSALGVILDANSFVAVRHLMPPEDLAAPNRRYNAGGITGTGDVFGMVNSVRGHFPAQDHHREDPVVWKRSNNYEGRVVFGGLPYFIPAFAFNAPSKLQADLDSGVVTDAIRQLWSDQGVPLADNAIVNTTKTGWSIEEPATPPGCRNTGQPCQVGLYVISNQGDQLEVRDHSPTKPKGIHVVRVSEGGYAAGQWNVDNANTYFYDMNEDKFVDFYGGWGQDVNNHRIVLSQYDNYSEAPPPFIASPEAITEEEPRGWIYEFGDNLALTGINDDNILVGGFEDNPIRIMPTGTVAGGENGFPTYNEFNAETDVMEELGPAFSASRAVDISSNDTPYITGVSFDFSQFGNVGVIWNLEGEIIQKLGVLRVPKGITEDGTIVYGRIDDILGGSARPALWMTDDGWKNFTELVLDDLLADLKNADVPGAAAVERFDSTIGDTCCSIAGVNGSGQVVAQGYPNPDAPSILSPANGAVYLLDTLPLDAGVIKGDVNNDGVVDFLDITPFINAQAAEGEEQAFLLLTPGGCLLCADIDMDGAIDFLDITPFVNLLDQLGAAAVPAPASATLLVMMGLVSAWRRRYRLRIQKTSCEYSS